MSNRLLASITVAALVIAVRVTTAEAHALHKLPSDPCASSDSAGLRLRGELQAMIADTDSEAAVARDSLYHVPVVPANAVTFVTDTLVCRQVAAVFTARRIDTTAAPTTRVYVLSLNGVAYAAKDANDPYTVLVLSPQFAVTGGYSGP
jgi:hypothetical protein